MIDEKGLIWQSRSKQIVTFFPPLLIRALNSQSSFQSEWRKTPQQAAQVREFMLGLAEVIAAIFCATVNPICGGFIAYRIAADGTLRMYSAFNNIWGGHQAMIELKNWEQTSLKAAANE